MSDKANYTTIDSLLVTVVTEGTSKFGNIELVPEVKAEALKLARASGRDSFRIIDQRLQALRKKGTLVYKNGSGWSAA